MGLKQCADILRSIVKGEQDERGDCGLLKTLKFLLNSKMLWKEWCKWWQKIWSIPHICGAAFLWKEIITLALGYCKLRTRLQKWHHTLSPCQKDNSRKRVKAIKSDPYLVWSHSEKISTGILCRTSSQKPLDTIQACDTSLCQCSPLPKYHILLCSSIIVSENSFKYIFDLI